ncbi:hypothetical protein GPECTOR_25g339 [Gonium pectorale]|uniref:Uncharacterized protein n=1 Tax=Gonium pectorale TaxID=33097 RepID=A0A150GGK7_GONPE|nr:hypothetical protein GPECTOR_25g339 [Gonium pectorale]|eukprot:KXZ48755.1 hypothetical protein GPECTOR_25g339 [Gonium pectorale]
MGKLPTCMVLGKALPSNFLVAGHLYAVRWTRYTRAILGSDFDVDSPKNGVICCSAIEYEYERQRICFSEGDIESEYILHVLDKSLLPIKLSSVGQHKGNAAFAAALGDVTFEHLDKKRVKFAGADGKGPFKRTLALHAKFALEFCAKTYPDGFDAREYRFDYHSEHEGKQALIHKWLGQLDTASVAEVVEEEEQEEEKQEGEEQEGEEQEGEEQQQEEEEDV